MLRVLLATSNVFVSLVLGALAMGAVWYLWPESIQQLFLWASSVKSWLVNRGLPPRYNNFLWFLIEERQLVYMGFVMATRMLLASLVALGAWTLARE